MKKETEILASLIALCGGRCYYTDMENTESKNITEIKLFIDFAKAVENKSALHANQMTLQIQDGEVFLSFFQLIPPIQVKGVEEQFSREEDRVIIPECVVRLATSPQFLKKVHRVIGNNLNKLGVIDDDDDSSDDEVA